MKTEFDSPATQAVVRIFGRYISITTFLLVPLRPPKPRQTGKGHLRLVKLYVHSTGAHNSLKITNLHHVWPGWLHGKVVGDDERPKLLFQERCQSTEVVDTTLIRVSVKHAVHKPQQRISITIIHAFFLP